MKRISVDNEFECPLCGGHFFGMGAGNTRHCHQGGRCTFSCKESELWKYMRLVKKYKYESAEEYGS